MASSPTPIDDHAPDYSAVLLDYTPDSDQLISDGLDASAKRVDDADDRAASLKDSSDSQADQGDEREDEPIGDEPQEEEEIEEEIECGYSPPYPPVFYSDDQSDEEAEKRDQGSSPPTPLSVLITPTASCATYELPESPQSPEGDAYDASAKHQIDGDGDDGDARGQDEDSRAEDEVESWQRKRPKTVRTYAGRRSFRSSSPPSSPPTSPPAPRDGSPPPTPLFKRRIILKAPVRIDIPDAEPFRARDVNVDASRSSALEEEGDTAQHGDEDESKDYPARGEAGTRTSYGALTVPKTRKKRFTSRGKSRKDHWLESRRAAQEEKEKQEESDRESALSGRSGESRGRKRRNSMSFAGFRSMSLAERMERIRSTAQREVDSDYEDEEEDRSSARGRCWKKPRLSTQSAEHPNPSAFASGKLSAVAISSPSAKPWFKGPKASRGIKVKPECQIVRGETIFRSPLNFAALHTALVDTHCWGCHLSWEDKAERESREVEHCKQGYLQCSRCEVAMWCGLKCYASNAMRHFDECRAMQRCSRIPSAEVRVIAKVFDAMSRGEKIALTQRHLPRMGSRDKPQLVQLAKKVFAFLAQSHLGQTQVDWKSYGLTTQAEAGFLVRQLQSMIVEMTDGLERPVGLCIVDVPTRMTHSCDPNAYLAYPEGLAVGEPLRVMALRDIAEGEEITLAHVDLAMPHALREEVLRERGFVHPCDGSECAESGRRDRVIGKGDDEDSEDTAGDVGKSSHLSESEKSSDAIEESNNEDPVDDREIEHDTEAVKHGEDSPAPSRDDTQHMRSDYQLSILPTTKQDEATTDADAASLDEQIENLAADHPETHFPLALLRHRMASLILLQPHDAISVEDLHIALTDLTKSHWAYSRIYTRATPTTIWMKIQMIHVRCQIVQRLISARQKMVDWQANTRQRFLRNARMRRLSEITHDSNGHGAMKMMLDVSPTAEQEKHLERACELRVVQRALGLSRLSERKGAHRRPAAFGADDLEEDARTHVARMKEIVDQAKEELKELTDGVDGDEVGGWVVVKKLEEAENAMGEMKWMLTEAGDEGDV